MNPSLNQSNIKLRNFTNTDIDSLHKLLHDTGPHGHREWPDTTSGLISALKFPRVQPHKNLVLAHLENRLNSAKMLKELCVINDDVTYCLVEKKKLVKQSCGEVSV